jgi:hypothetical protein
MLKLRRLALRSSDDRASEQPFAEASEMDGMFITSTHPHLARQRPLSPRYQITIKQKALRNLRRRGGAIFGRPLFKFF